MLVHVTRITLPMAIIAVALLGYRWAAVPAAAPPEPLFRDRPWRVTPQYDWPLVATDKQLLAVLERVKPPLGPANTNQIHHALRLWGVEAEFDDPAIATGRQMRDYFLDDAEFRRRAGDDVPPLMTLTDNGRVEVRSFEEGLDHLLTTSHHIDDLLATLVKANTPPDAPLKTRNGETTFRALLETALNRAHMNQHENEWTMIVYARTVFPRMQWTNQYGEQVEADAMIGELLDRPIHHGTCAGTHRLEALVLLLRVDDQTNVLPDPLRQRILDHLKEVSRLLVQSQTREGYWTRYWMHGDKAADFEQGADYDRLLATGHHLEWMALAPVEVLPPRETIVRAAQWSVRTMLEVDDRLLDQKYGPLTHVARALSLWRGVEPYEAWRKLKQQGAW